MGKIAGIVLILTALFMSVPAGAHTPHDRITTLAVSPAYPSDSTILCCLSDLNYVILRSSDDGITWSTSQNDFVHCRVRCLELSPGFAQDQIAFAATEGGHVLKSSDGGVTWNLCDTGLTDSGINALAVSPFFPVDQTLFIGTSGSGILKSIDGGTTWAACNDGLSVLYVYALDISPSFDEDRTLYAGAGGNVFKSENSGMTWFDPVMTGFPSESRMTGLAVSPNYYRDRTVFVTMWGDGVVKSEDGGVTWQCKYPFLCATSAAFSPNFKKDDTLFVTTRDEVLRSTDGGDNWSVVIQGLDTFAIQTDVHYFKIDFSSNYKHDKTLFLAAWEGVHVSKDGGDSWKHLDVYNVNVIRGVAVSPNFASDGTVIAGAYGGGVYRSVDKGDTWEAIDTGLSEMYLRSSPVFSPAYGLDKTVFSTSSWGGCFDKSTVEGDAWFPVQVSATDTITARALALSPDFISDQTLFFGNGYDGQCAIYKSSNGGASFTPLDPPFRGVLCLELSPQYSSDKTLFAGIGSGLYRSENGGLTWEYLDACEGDVFGLAISPTYSSYGIVFIGTPDEGVLRSVDGGDTWAHMNNGIDDLVVQDVAVSPVFQKDWTVFAGTKSGGLFKSTNGGAGWISSGLHGTFVRSISLSPEYGSDQTIFLGTWDGVYRSFDGGGTWEQVLHICRYGSDNEFVAYGGTWYKKQSLQVCESSVRYSGETNAVCSLSFMGDAISWIGAKASMGGIARVEIDEVFEDNVDLYSPQIELREVVFSKSGMKPGLHNIRITVTGECHPMSTGKLVFVDAFEVER